MSKIPFDIFLKIEPGFEDFVPEEFRKSPLSYFEVHGVNIKQGEVEYDAEGKITEDPTAVKDLPVWENSAGERLRVVGKRVNIEKGKVAKAGDPFYEYHIMQQVVSKGLPGPNPIAKASEGEAHIIVMENVAGFRWSYRNSLKKRGFSDADVDVIHKQGETIMAALQKHFEAQGVFRDWKLSDMIFDIDIQNKKIKSLVPVDWERTEIIETTE